MKKFYPAKVFIYLFTISISGVAGFMIHPALATLIYPDPCIYHFKPAPQNIFFSIFFDYDSSTGFHPEPSLFSFYFFLFAGMATGFCFTRLLTKAFKPKSLMPDGN
jgi:hypothetical protein